MTPETLTQVEELLKEAAGPAELAPALRSRFPDLALSSCDASDVLETPFRRFALFDLHLLNSRDHCTHITTDPDCATGLLLARRKG